MSDLDIPGVTWATEPKARPCGDNERKAGLAVTGDVFGREVVISAVSERWSGETSVRLTCWSPAEARALAERILHAARVAEGSAEIGLLAVRDLAKLRGAHAAR